MTTNQILKALDEAETLITNAINKQMPPDDVPDRLAIPRLNRLEECHLKAGEAFSRIRLMLSHYVGSDLPIK